MLLARPSEAMRRTAAARPERVGLLVGPGKSFSRSALGAGLPYAADNNCFSGLDAPAFLRMLAALVGRPSPLFVAAPDVVADARATLRAFAVWGPLVRELGLPVALVGQDGLTPDAAPWDDLDAYFVGGSTAWKLSRESYLLTQEAKERGKHLHMGRVNSLERIKVAAVWGCDTIDGTANAIRPDVRLPEAVRWIDQALAYAAEPTLWRTT